MKKGFTMIELIFVIVILGVLAAVAIPKLNATRDDAEQAKAMTNLATLMGDLTSYYTAQGNFDTDISKMTNVPLVKKTDTAANDNGQYGTSTFKAVDTTNNIGNVYAFEIKNKPCIAFQIDGASLRIASAASVTDSPVCSKILANTSTQNIMSGNYKCGTVKFTNAWAFDPELGNITTTMKGACNTVLESLADGTSNETKEIEAKVGITAANQSVILSFEGAGVKF